MHNEPPSPAYQTISARFGQVVETHIRPAAATSFRGAPPSMKSRPPGTSAAEMRLQRQGTGGGWRPSSAPTLTAKAIRTALRRLQGRNLPRSRTASSSRPAAISSAEPSRAWAMALAERSMARTWPLPILAATARAAAPGRSRSPARAALPQRQRVDDCGKTR